MRGWWGGDAGKPDPEGFLLAAERLRVRAERCVVVEDADAGLKAARAAGMKSVGIGGGVTAGCDARAKQVGELTVEGLEIIAGESI